MSSEASQGKAGQCYFCPKKSDLHTHHIIPQRFGGPESSDNTVTLCSRCHRKIERLYDKSFYEWFGVDDETGEREYHRPCSYYECGERAEVKLRHPMSGKTVLQCRKCARREIKKEYNRNMSLESDPTSMQSYRVYDSIEQCWSKYVMEVATGVRDGVIEGYD